MEFIKATKSKWILPLEERLTNYENLLNQVKRYSSFDSAEEFLLESKNIINKLWNEYKQNKSEYIKKELLDFRAYTKEFIALDYPNKKVFSLIGETYNNYAIMMSSNAHYSEFCLE